MNALVVGGTASLPSRHCHSSGVEPGRGQLPASLGLPRLKTSTKYATFSSSGRPISSSISSRNENNRRRSTSWRIAVVRRDRPGH
jgi:hypothetical protein